MANTDRQIYSGFKPKDLWPVPHIVVNSVVKFYTVCYLHELGCRPWRGPAPGFALAVGNSGNAVRLLSPRRATDSPHCSRERAPKT